MTTQPAYQQRQSRLLSLPRELRDEIYTYYLQEPGGYVHSPSTNKLRCYDGQIIDFSLMWTCKMVASEMRDLPLRVNEVVFRPFRYIKSPQDGSDIWDAWSQAGKYDFLLERLHFLQEEAFVLGASTSGQSIIAVKCLPPKPRRANRHVIALEQLAKDVSEQYPDSCISDLLTRISKYEDEDYVPLKDIMGNPSSMTYHDREVLQACLPSLTSQADFSERLKSRSCCVDILGFGPALKLSRFRTNIPRRNRGFSILDRLMKNWYETSPHDERERQSIEQLSLLKLDHMRSTIATTLWQPWALPTEDQLIEVRDLFEDPRPDTWYNFEVALLDLRYFQSATSQAIRFLDALQPQHRKQMRNVEILEEEKSAALPECHLRGMLPTCDAVPQLSVDRYFDLWRCV